MRILLALITSLILSNCTSIPPELKSPCVAIESSDGAPSPCIRRPVNAHWLG